jgi:hypothetical protein
MGGMSYARSVIFEWLDQTLCGKEGKNAPDAGTRAAFVEIFKKYGGIAAAENAAKLLEVARLV